MRRPSRPACVCDCEPPGREHARGFGGHFARRFHGAEKRARAGGRSACFPGFWVVFRAAKKRGRTNGPSHLRFCGCRNPAVGEVAPKTTQNPVFRAFLPPRRARFFEAPSSTPRPARRAGGGAVPQRNRTEYRPAQVTGDGIGRNIDLGGFPHLQRSRFAKFFLGSAPATARPRDRAPAKWRRPRELPGPSVHSANL